MCERGVWCYPLSTLPLRPRPYMLWISLPTTQSVHWRPVNVWQRCVRGGDQVHRRRDPVLDEDRLHGLAPPAARAGGCAYALQRRVHESALGRAAGRAKGVSVAMTQLPVQACGALPDGDWRKNITVYATYFSYPTIYARASACGLPASTVTLTIPAPNTCDGAITRLMNLSM